jgi:hypothetical protein
MRCLPAITSSSRSGARSSPTGRSGSDRRGPVGRVVVGRLHASRARSPRRGLPRLGRRGAVGVVARARLSRRDRVRRHPRPAAGPASARDHGCSRPLDVLVTQRVRTGEGLTRGERSRADHLVSMDRIRGRAPAFAAFYAVSGGGWTSLGAADRSRSGRSRSRRPGKGRSTFGPSLGSQPSEPIQERDCTAPLGSVAAVSCGGVDSRRLTQRAEGR